MLHYQHITQLIAELLYKHDCVIVPNFGGFVARQSGAHFSKGNSQLHPPTKHLLFNKNLVHQDGLLVSALMESNASSYVEANEQLKDYTDYIQSLLQAKKRFELNNIGLLYIDTENSLRFEPKADVNFLIDSFGFEPVIANELIIEPEKQIVEKQFEDRRISIEAISTKRKKSYAKIASLAIGIPATLAFLLFAAYSKPMQPLLQSSLNPFYTPAKTYNPLNSKYSKAVIIGDIQKQALIEDANGFATFQLAENSPVLVATSHVNSNESKEHSSSKSTKLNHSSFEGPYQVVMGCFGMMNNAEKMVSELEKSHIASAVNGVNAKGLHVVSCGGFNTKEEAEQLLATVKNNYPKAWIMSK